jgi:rhamnosyltransferase subunit B
MSRRIVLATLGSLGDLHPFIAIALQLKARGHAPILATSPMYLENVTAAGIGFHAMRPDPDSIMRDLDMDLARYGRAVMRDTMFILESAVFPYLRQTYDDLLPAIDGASLVLSSSLLFAARFAAERLGVPQMTVALQPMVFVSAHDPPAVNPAPWLAPVLAKLGPRVTRAVYGCAKRLASRRAGALSAFRRELGLPRSDLSPLFEGQFSPYGTFAAYSRLLASAQPDYPPNTWVTGFAFYDGAVAPMLDPELEEFLASGPPPLVFTLGSFAVEFADDFFRIGLEVARELRLRVVILAGPRHGDEYRSHRTSTVHIAGSAPYSRLFPRSLAIIHHGGIGTLGQALRAGRPQLIVPLLSDQFDNAARAARLGVARMVARRRYTVRRVTAEIRRLSEDPAFARRAAQAAASVAGDRGAERIAEAIEGFLQSAIGQSAIGGSG